MKSKTVGRVLYLADRNILIDQTMTQDFKPFTKIMCKVGNKNLNSAYENQKYFGEPVYTYSLNQGIEDGFLAPYKVIRINIDKGLDGWRPSQGMTDLNGNLISNVLFTQSDFEKNLVIEERTKLIAKRITQWLKENGRYNKTIVFCVDIEHAERMRRALINENQDIVKDYPNYIMKITGDDDGEKNSETETGEESPEILPPPTPPTPRSKYYVNGVEVNILNELVQYIGNDGRLITESLTDYSKKNILQRYATLNNFITAWTESEKTNAITDELTENGVFLDELENFQTLRNSPFSNFGSPASIVKLFGGKNNYLQTISELKKLIYEAA